MRREPIPRKALTQDAKDMAYTPALNMSINAQQNHGVRCAAAQDLLDPLACKLLALPVERLMVGIFVDKDHRQQARPGKAARDRVERRRRLRDLLASPAAELLPHMLGHEPLPWHYIKCLGDIFADLGELAAAAARAGRWCGLDDAPARQIGGKVAARCLVPREALHLDLSRLDLALIFTRSCGEFLKLQFQLIDKPLSALGARAEHLPLHFGDYQPQMLISASAPESLARASINAAFSASTSS